MAKINYKIHRAAYHGDIDTLKALVSDGEDANSRNRKGNTPLVSALIGTGNKKTKAAILDLLLRSGADCNLVNNEGDSILHVAVKATFHKKIPSKIVEKLINYGADRKLVNKQSLTACQLAFQVNNSKLGTLLLFYEKPELTLEEKPTFSNISKGPPSSGGGSIYQNIQRKSPGLLGSLLKFITGPFTMTVYEFENQGERDSRRLYDDVNITEGHFQQKNSLVPADSEDTLKNLDDDNQEEENRMLKLNETKDHRIPPFEDAPTYSNALGHAFIPQNSRFTVDPKHVL